MTCKYVYIVSAGHSGSTLLDMLLGAHHNFQSLGEITHFPKNLALNSDCSCGVPVRSCEYWGCVLNRLKVATGHNMYLDPYSHDMGLIAAREIVDLRAQNFFHVNKRRFLHAIQYLFLRIGIPEVSPSKVFFNRTIGNKLAFYDAVRSTTGCQAIIDSSKTYIQAIELYRRQPVNTRIILLVRDGRGVFFSNIKRQYPKKEGIQSWRNVYARVVPLLQKFVKPDHFLCMRYEDLAINTEFELKRLCAFLGQQYSGDMLGLSPNDRHIANGNDVRFSKSLNVKLDESWRNELSENDLKYFNRHAGKLNRQLGYE